MPSSIGVAAIGRSAPVLGVASDYLLDDLQGRLIVALRAADMCEQQQGFEAIRPIGKHQVERLAGLLRQIEREPCEGHADDWRHFVRLQIAGRLEVTHGFHIVSAMRQSFGPRDERRI